jgi:hypothetical protein
MKSTLLSSNSTLFYRLFLPAFLTVFLTAFCIAAWQDEDGGLLANTLPPNIGNGIFTLLLLSWVYFAYKKLWNLRRVEADDQHLYISDYWLTVKYDLDDIETVTERKRAWISMASIVLKGKGRFGREIRFVKGREAKEWIEKRRH